MSTLPPRLTAPADAPDPPGGGAGDEIHVADCGAPQRSWMGGIVQRVSGDGEVGRTKFILLLATFLSLFTNGAFFSNVLDVYPVSAPNLPFLVTLAWAFTGALVIALSLVCGRMTTKPIAIALLVVSSITAYFMDTYNTIIDASMLENVVNTDAGEVGDLLSLRLAGYVVLLGLLPSMLVLRTTIAHEPLLADVKRRMAVIGLALVSILLPAAALSGHFSSFLREHKSLRYYSNPGCIVNATAKYVSQRLKPGPAELQQIGLDARVERAEPVRKLVIFVVGEAARADRFSLNGYARETTPLLAAAGVVNFPDFWSYGTSTATSLPCMFSLLGEDDYDHDRAESTENVLDVLQRAGVHVLWRDNNSTSKGVADRVPYESFKRATVNPVCDVECRDVGMLSDLQSIVDGCSEGDIFVVLHQMGSHGPAYYKRYPIDFERFTPVRQTSQLEECSDEELGNAYDNTILYTDYFLAQAIDFLSRNDPAFDVALFYASDHGESLGENGLYLHGLPPFMAPDTQRHVPAIVWLGESFSGVDRARLEAVRTREYSHDHLSHSILGMLDVKTSAYDPTLDLFRSDE